MAPTLFGWVSLVFVLNEPVGIWLTSNEVSITATEVHIGTGGIEIGTQKCDILMQTYTDMKGCNLHNFQSYALVCDAWFILPVAKNYEG